MKRAEESIPESTKKPLLESLVSTLIAEHAKTLIRNETQGCEVMFEECRICELARLFQLFSRVPNTLFEVQSVMKSCIIRNGTRLDSGTVLEFRV